MLLTVVVAEPQRMTALRDGLPTPGRVLRYPSSNLASALESIRANQPGLIILDSAFLQGETGQGFVERINGLGIAKLVLQQALFDHGHWTMASLDAATPAPRFPVQDVAQAVADGGPIDVVDLSVLGAQMISQPMLRPNQKIKVGLPDTDGSISLTASVAWSVYEKPANAPGPRFRVGVEFSNTEAANLEEYCKRHCKPDPLPLRR